jgi:hypothetical protein
MEGWGACTTALDGHLVRRVVGAGPWHRYQPEWRLYSRKVEDQPLSGHFDVHAVRVMQQCVRRRVCARSHDVCATVDSLTHGWVAHCKLGVEAGLFCSPVVPYYAHARSHRCGWLRGDPHDMQCRRHTREWVRGLFTVQRRILRGYWQSLHAFVTIHSLPGMSCSFACNRV